ncbi:30S ribosomal protein S21 [Cupriavidus sp. AU9028]|uniref:30S ribosomal protein S21 n=1 Tax=Cupriavidus sp. AU9028 TaxID=2871157 RepID=UPI001C96FA5B|nr:30S ribosomal protein S21 [Cupriavidus sp. AU9028]MBY4896368.1 30S ribosomal protein S21 [Cupriavidus sp. AU9028]
MQASIREYGRRSCGACAVDTLRSNPPREAACRGQPLTKIVLKPGEPVEVAMRRFRRAILQNGLIVELKSRTAYEKPTTERKRKKKAAESRLRKRLRMQMLPKKLY